MNRCFYALILLLVPLFARAANKQATRSAIKIESVNVKVFDRQKNVFVENGKQSDPYGLQNDLLVTVTLANLGEKEVTLKVTGTTPKTSDEARGEVKATSQVNAKKVFAGDSAVSKTVTIPFLFNFECNPMTFVAEIEGQKIKKEIKVPLACAE